MRRPLQSCKSPRYMFSTCTISQDRARHQSSKKGGEMGYFDVTIVNPQVIAPCIIRNFNPLTIFNSFMTENHRRYQSSISVSPETVRLLSVLLSTVGGWHLESFFIVTGLERAVLSRAVRIKWRQRERTPPTTRDERCSRRINWYCTVDVNGNRRGVIVKVFFFSSKMI